MSKDHINIKERKPLQQGIKRSNVKTNQSLVYVSL
jgi:hypothetical protein